MLTQSKSKKKPTIQASLNIRVTMRDGVELATHVYLPEGKGPFPVMLFRTPYDALMAGEGVFVWPGRGYAMVRQDVRGRFLSEGDWYPWIFEERDGEATLDWIAGQPWCDGNVAMYGGSYLSGTQLLLAVSGHPALKCITPCLIGMDVYRSCYTGGAFRLGRLSSWLLQLGANSNRQEIGRHLPLVDADKICTGQQVQHWRDALAHPRADGYWQACAVSERADRIMAPAFIRSGWFDLFITDLFEFFNALRLRGGTENVRRFSRILIGPWPHEINRRVVGEEDFGKDAVVDDLMAQEVDFIQRFTREHPLPSAEVAPVRIFIMGVNQWRDEWEWPLARTVWTEYFLAGSQGLASTPGEGSASFTYDPADPVPTNGGAWDFDNIGPKDQTEIEKRADVLIFTSAPLAEDLEVTGPLEARLFVSSSARDTDFTVKLVDVRLNGSAMSVTDGIVRARYRNVGAGEELLLPGEVTEVKIRCNPTAYVFRRGHCLRIEISSSNFPAFSRNLNTGNDPATDVIMQVANQTVFHSKEYPSAIILPVIKKQKQRLPRLLPAAVATDTICLSDR